MIVPQLPTDSFYKFKAITGLALILFSLTVPPKFYHDVNLRAFEVRRQLACWNAEQQIALQQQQLVGKIVKSQLEETQSVAKLLKEKPFEQRTENDHELASRWTRELEAGQKDAMERHDRVSEQAKIAARAGAEIRVNALELDFLIGQARVLFSIGAIGLLAGISLMFIGLKNWYRIQQLQDQIVQSQAKANANGSANENATQQRPRGSL